MEINEVKHFENLVEYTTFLKELSNKNERFVIETNGTQQLCAEGFLFRCNDIVDYQVLMNKEGVTIKRLR